MQLTTGQRLQSAVDTTEVIVVRAPHRDVELTCGGHPLIPIDTEKPQGVAADPAWTGETAIGKRYAHPEYGLELLCTRPGQSALGVNGAPLEIKMAASLPSSD